MSFAIQFCGPYNPDENTYKGEIVIGDHTESFWAPLWYWSVADYERQWKEGLIRVVEGQTKSCLITSMNDPTLAKFIFWWPLYRVGNQIYIQNHILFLDKRLRFSEKDLYERVPDREVLSDEGDPISEWATTTEVLSSILQRG